MQKVLMVFKTGWHELVPQAVRYNSMRSGVVAYTNVEFDITLEDVKSLIGGEYNTFTPGEGVYELAEFDLRTLGYAKQELLKNSVMCVLIDGGLTVALNLLNFDSLDTQEIFRLESSPIITCRCVATWYSNNGPIST